MTAVVDKAVTVSIKTALPKAFGRDSDWCYRCGSNRGYLQATGMNCGGGSDDGCGRRGERVSGRESDRNC